MVERRPILRHDSMICFDDGADRFQMRAAGIALRNGRVLVQDVSGDPLKTIPGGRIDQNESSVNTVIREMHEEFGLTVSIGPLAFVIESFFPEKGQLFHEIGFYYPIVDSEIFPYRDEGVCYRFQEGAVEIEYSWVEVTPEALTASQLVPNPLRTRLGAMPAAPVHILDGRAA